MFAIVSAGFGYYTSVDAVHRMFLTGNNKYVKTKKIKIKRQQRKLVTPTRRPYFVFPFDFQSENIGFFVHRLENKTKKKKLCIIERISDRQ